MKYGPDHPLPDQAGGESARSFSGDVNRLRRQGPDAPSPSALLRSGSEVGLSGAVYGSIAHFSASAELQSHVHGIVASGFEASVSARQMQGGQASGAVGTAAQRPGKRGGIRSIVAPHLIDGSAQREAHAGVAEALAALGAAVGELAGIADGNFVVTEATRRYRRGVAM